MLQKITFIIAIIVCAVLLGPCLGFAALLRAFRLHRLSNRMAHWFSVPFARLLVWSTWTRVIVTGYENLPSHNNLCIVANHQNFGDIPLLYGWVNRYMGFIAKAELGRVPLLNFWIWSLRSILIDRSSGRSALKAIREGINSIKNGHPLAVFPEGTRSKCGRMGEFKKGSLKLATKSGGTIVPVTINGSWKIFSSKRLFHLNTINMVIHEPLETAGADKFSNDLAERVEAVIRNGFNKWNQ